jgi:nitroreductase
LRCRSVGEPWGCIRCWRDGGVRRCSTGVRSPRPRSSSCSKPRGAPSAGNSQPWSFIVGHRGDETHGRLVRHLAASSARWAPTAGLLIANLCHRFVEDTDWDYSEFAQYDLGQAVAHVTVQARAIGLHVRQFRAFDRAGIASEFAVPAHWEVTSMSAVGRVPKPIEPEAVYPALAPERRRRPLDDLLWREDRLAEPN